jgi:peroxiredoxin
MAESSTPKVGDAAPEVKLQGVGGKEWSLADLRGKRKAVLLFYVLDWTPG